MAKIRGVKPDLWTDEDFVELSPYARLLWLGLWNFCCDNGHLADKPKQIKMRVLPTDDVNCAQLLREIEAQGLIVRDGSWITVPNLTRHQRPDRRYFTTCEMEGCEAPPQTVSQRESRRVHAVQTTGTRRAHVGRTPGAHVDGDGDGDGDKDLSVDSASASPTRSDRFEEFWSAYPGRGSHANPKKPAKAKWDRAVKATDPDKIIAAASAYAETRRGQDPQHTAQAVTWLNQERWNDQSEAEPQRPVMVNPPRPPGDMPEHLFGAWNRAHADAIRNGSTPPSDWRQLREAS